MTTITATIETDVSKHSITFEIEEEKLKTASIDEKQRLIHNILVKLEHKFVSALYDGEIF